LAVHAVVFPQDLDVQDALAAVDEAVLERYGKNADIGFFHWGLMAAAARYQATRDPRLAEFTLAQLRAYLGELRPHLNPNSNSCYSVEGMAAAMQVLRESDREEQMRQLLRIRIQAEMEQNVALQIPLGACEIPLGDMRELRSPDLKRFAGAFLNGRARPQIRIDATQHCLSAMLKQRPESILTAPPDMWGLHNLCRRLDHKSDQPTAVLDDAVTFYIDDDVVDGAYRSAHFTRQVHHQQAEL